MSIQISNVTKSFGDFVALDGQWGGRLCFGVGEHAPERVRALVIGGNQPYGWPDTSLARVVTNALAAGPRGRAWSRWSAASRSSGESSSQTPRGSAGSPTILLPSRRRGAQRAREGAISADLGRWRVPCLIFIGAGDADFLEGARRAVREIPRAELLVLEEADHYAAHMSQDEVVLDAVLRTLRRY